MALHEFQAKHFNQLLPPVFLLLDFEMSTKKIVEVEIFLVDLSFSGLDKVFVCMLSRPIWDEFPESPGRYYFELNRKLIFAQAFVRLSYSTVLYHKVDRLFSRSRYDRP